MDCDKTPYADHVAANQALKKTKARRGRKNYKRASKGRVETYAYKCDRCDYYHLTSRRT